MTIDIRKRLVLYLTSLWLLVMHLQCFQGMTTTKLAKFTRISTTFDMINNLTLLSRSSNPTNCGVRCVSKQGNDNCSAFHYNATEGQCLCGNFAHFKSDTSPGESADFMVNGHCERKEIQGK